MGKKSNGKRWDHSRAQTGYLSGAPLTRKAFLTGLLGTGAAMALTACTAPYDQSDNQGEIIRFSVFSGDKSRALTELWAPLLGDMRQQTGLNLQPYFASDDEALIRAMRDGDIQAGWFSNIPGLEAVRGAQGEVFAEAVPPENLGRPRALIITHAHSKLTAKDLLRCDRSLDFGMGERTSLSGTQAALYYFFRPGNTNPADCFKRVSQGNHSRHITQVVNGRLDAVISDKFVLVDWLKNAADGACCKLIGDVNGTETEAGIAVRLDDNALREKFNAAIDAIVADGTCCAHAKRSL